MSITIKQIAELCNVSRGTVDRALNNKGNVRPEVCEKIKRVAKEHGYTPNRAGRALVRARKPMRIGAIIHSTSTPFMKMLLEHLTRTTEEVADLGVQVLLRCMAGIEPNEMLSAIEDLVHNEQIEGLAITPLANIQIQEKINELVEKYHIPVITLNSDLPNSKRVAYVGQDNIAAGRAAAGLMGLLIGDHPTKILPITGHSSAHLVYTERLLGFTGEIHVKYQNSTLLPVQNCFDSDETAENLVKETLKKNPDLRGIYIASNGYIGVCRALIDLNKQSDIFVIAHDLTEHNLIMAREQVINFVIGQQAQTQGSLPIKLLQGLIDDGKTISHPKIHTAIEVRFHYNIFESDF